MADPAITQDEQRLKQRAMRRLAIALTLIAAAIVLLALLDRYNASLKKPEPAVSPPREATAPPPTQPPIAEPTTPPPSTEQAKPPPPPPVVSNQALPAPTATQPPAATPTYPLPPESAAKKPPATPAPEKPSAPAAEQKPPAVAQSPPPATTPPAEKAQTSKGFLVQVGVFMSAANARALQSKLAEKNIPTHTETRVVVGPFKDRTEAEAVIRQLKEMGVGSVVVSPPGPQ